MQNGHPMLNPNLILRPTGKFRSKGEVYEVFYDGELIASGTSPECAACREMEKRGATGTASFSREGGKTADLLMPIAWAAKKYVAEDRIGMRFAKWSEFKFEKAEELEEVA